MLLGPSRAELKSILVESFSTPSRLKGFVRDHLTTPVDYERSGLKHEENVGELADTLDSAGLMDTFLKEVQREFQGDVPKTVRSDCSYPSGAAIVKRMEPESNSHDLSNLGKALGSLIAKLELPQRLARILTNPLIVEVPRDSLLKAFYEADVFGEKLYEGEEQDLDIWKYVDWTKDTERRGKSGIDLRRSSNGSNHRLAP